MKKFLFALIIAISMLGGSSCDNSLNPPTEKEQIVQLVKAPDVIAYSGDNIIGSTFWFNTRNMNLPAMYGANTEGNMWSQNWDCPPNVNLSDEDLAELISMFEIGHEVTNNVVIPWENYFVQQVYKGESTYTPLDKFGDECNNIFITGSDQMDKLGGWNGNDYDHINNFNKGDNQTIFGEDDCGISHKGTTLMIGMPTENIDPTSQFAYHESYGTDHFYTNYIILQYKGEWYIGFDYEMIKPGTNNANEAAKVERDWNFTDWIVKIIPGKNTYQDPTGTPVVDDPSKDVESETPEQPNQPEVTIPEVNSHVEVNLSIEERLKYLTSHLSIHVRAATDVEVFIPVPATYVCEADDFAIVEKHEENFVVYSPSDQTYNINGKTVKLIIDIEDGGIRVKTDGIDEDVISYCKENYGDGITFEVWNYFNIKHSEWENKTHDYLDLTKLKEYLNESTIEFLDNDPDLYVNAFMYETGEAEYHEGHEGIFCDDCIVTPQNYNQEHNSGYWYNGSPYNELYYK